METFLEHLDFMGEKAVCARNAELEMIVVPGWGSTVISLKSRLTGSELLRKPANAGEFWKKPVLYGIPVLFPPNRIEDGTFSWRGKRYQFDINQPETHNHIHGFLHDKKWELVGAKYEAGKVVVETLFDSQKEPDVMRQFPHPFTVKMSFVLEGGTLTQTASITNEGSDAFPWGLGYHTTFNFPFVPGNPLSACRFSLSADKRWELSERFLPTGELKDIPDREGLNGDGWDLTGRPLDDAFLSAAANGSERNEAVLEDRTAGIRVRYRADSSYKHWVIYNNDSKQGYLCPEPYTWITNAPNLDLDPALTGIRELAPGGKASAVCSITVESLK